MDGLALGMLTFLGLVWSIGKPEWVANMKRFEESSFDTWSGCGVLL